MNDPLFQKIWRIVNGLSVLFGLMSLAVGWWFAHQPDLQTQQLAILMAVGSMFGFGIPIGYFLLTTKNRSVKSYRASAGSWTDLFRTMDSKAFMFGILVGLPLSIIGVLILYVSYWLMRSVP